MERLNKSVRRAIYLHEKYGVYDCDKIGEVSIDDIYLIRLLYQIKNYYQRNYIYSCQKIK